METPALLYCEKQGPSTPGVKHQHHKDQCANQQAGVDKRWDVTPYVRQVVCIIRECEVERR